MRRHCTIAMIAALVLLAAGGCGDDAAPATTTTTAAPTSTTGATTTTTTSATTTTTLPDDLHPTWQVRWGEVWPAETAAATYLVQIMGSDTLEVPARLEYGLDWQGGTWDRLVLGTLEPGQDGAALYFARPEPWVLRLWGVAQTSTDREDVVLEHFEVPQDLDFTSLPDSPPTLEGSLLVEHQGGTFGPVPAIFQVEWVGVEDVEVAAGLIPGTYHVRFGLGGEFYALDGEGEIEFFSDLWLHPEQFIVKWEPGPAGGPIELSTPWNAPE
ncbi:MAG: hypothetical protein JW785_10205 [Acidimicrobiia bacterium]|nr:hypothetical protein [Acidimicrobiia bacterium]